MSQLSELCLSTLNVSGLQRDIHVQLHGAMQVVLEFISSELGSITYL